MNRQRSPTLAVLGCVRDGGAALVETLAEIARLCDVADVQRVIIGTNDNKDDTDDILSDLENGGRGAVSVIRLDGLTEAISKRTARIATVRNVILSHLWAQSAPEFTLILDLDGPNDSLPIERISANMAGRGPEGWVGLFANQTKAYYDLFALRHPAWCPDDIRKRYRIARLASVGLLPAKTIKRRLIYNRQYKIPEKSDPILVQSAFGGLGLYRTEAIRSCWYNGTSPLGTSVCEHVAFNRMVTRGQPGLFIDPAMMNHAPEEHLGPESGRTFPCEFAAS